MRLKLAAGVMLAVALCVSTSWAGGSAPSKPSRPSKDSCSTNCVSGRTYAVTICDVTNKRSYTDHWYFTSDGRCYSTYSSACGTYKASKFTICGTVTYSNGYDLGSNSNPTTVTFKLVCNSKSTCITGVGTASDGCSKPRVLIITGYKECEGESNGGGDPA